ncbi:MAG: HAD-IB family hydrolase [Actinomycetota bacterium]|nr:HAD-IB family hydrolase [Actinomycetota bacterium]
MSVIKERLEGKRVLLTGATGFLGVALFERLLTDIPVGRLDLVIRGNAEKRMNRLLGGSAFRRAAQRLGDQQLRQLAAAKVRLLSTDLAVDSPEVGEDVDLVVHTAATVSFDPPVDQAFALNLRGSVRLYEACDGRPFIHISTAYVAGLTRGVQPEEPLGREVDWRAELDAALRARDETEDASRSPDLLRRLEARARSEMGRVGPQAVARRTEELRNEWIKTRLIEYGQARSRSLGWPDVYTFTKALTELALDELAGDNPLTIVRPSIIESALKRPYPGWIEGFRMAEPVILAFGRGALPEFPGIPEGALDLIPVDFVVNGILAAAARGPERRAIYHISSGARNPLRLRQMYELTREYFLADPLPEPGRGGYSVPEWSFPGRRAVDRRMATAERVISTAERWVGRLPRTRLARDAAHRIDGLRARLDFAQRYAGLYGPYTEIEALYTDHRCAALYESLPEEDQGDFPFDPTSFTWRHYLQEVHLPAVTAALRRVGARERRQPRVRISSDEAAERVVLAVFDVEGTILDSNVLEPYLWLRMADAQGLGRAREIARMVGRAPGWLRTERRDRGQFLRQFYRLYEGAGVDEAKRLAREVLGDLVLRRLAPGAVRRIRSHRAAGHRVVFVTGSLGLAVDALAPLADELVAATLLASNGRFTGDLERPPLVGEARASWLRDYARGRGADLNSSYAYGDSISDLPLLQTVGRPVAVNPDVALTRIARERRWPIEEWPSDPGTPKIVLPNVRS